MQVFTKWNIVDKQKNAYPVKPPADANQDVGAVLIHIAEHRGQETTNWHAVSCLKTLVRCIHHQ